MDRPDLAMQLSRSSPDDLVDVIEEQRSSVNLELALELKAVYDRAESSDPELAWGSAQALAAVAVALDDERVNALTAWVSGMAALDRGQMEAALELLADADRRYRDAGDTHAAASTQISRLIALAMLGRYDDAIATGASARDLFVASGDELAAGKIEQNLGNLYGRREQHQESEALFRAARDRFQRVGDEKQLAQVDNCLATALKWQHRFREAEPVYQTALQRANAEQLGVTAAEIENNLGILAFFQGRYDVALDYLERSRRHYASLNMPHDTAFADLELAEIYLELGLLPEALGMLERAIPVFEEAGMQAELARAWLGRGRALRHQGEVDASFAALDIASALFDAEGNEAGRGTVLLARAELLYAVRRFADTVDAAIMAEQALQGFIGRTLRTRWLRADSLRELGDLDGARPLLEEVLSEASDQVVLELVHRSETSLGLLHALSGDRERARLYFERAIDHIEELRAPLPVEDFRAAYLGGKLTAYSEMVRLYLDEDDTDSLTEALEYVERARSRALVDILASGIQQRPDSSDTVERSMLDRLEALREELNWFYSQINRPSDGESMRGPGMLEQLQSSARERELAILELQRQINQRQSQVTLNGPTDVIAHVQTHLDRDQCVVEYFNLDEELLAFVVSSETVRVVRALGTAGEVEGLIRGLRFQMDTLRYGNARVSSHMDQLIRRAQQHLQALHRLLVRPIENLLEHERVIIIPHKSLHYVPFQALFDGEGYLVERFEMSYAPSASVLLHCLQGPATRAESALVMGVADERIPRVRHEVERIANLFTDRVVLTDGDATIAALRENAGAADVVHLACHGYFRPDNPLFSSLQLADGWLSVRDAGELNLERSLVSLSACETGVSNVAPGDELIGIARGFIMAGAPTVLVSLWMVDDDSTATLMEHFYRELREGIRPAQALRLAQLQVMSTAPHPFYWSPFVLLGRW